MKIIRYKRLIPPIKPLTEGEPYCPRCMFHVDSCQCLVIEEVDKEEDK